MELISVIVPVYKVEPYLERCIKSVLEQTYTRFELILVDDGSPDRCGEICDEYAKKDTRIRVIHQENAGVSKARNVGIELAIENDESEWISFIDSDDWIHPKYLENLYNAVKVEGTEVSVCKYVITSNDSCRFLGEIEREVISPERLLRKSQSLTTVAWGKLYKKRLFLDIRYPVGKIREDAFVTWKVLFKVEKIAFISMPLYAYFQSKDSIMRSKWTINHLDVIEAYEEQLAFFEANGYRKALLDSVASYIVCLAQSIESLNRYYPKNDKIMTCKKSLRRLYWKYRKEIYFPVRKKVYIISMIVPFNANIIPYAMRKQRNMIEVWHDKGIKGVFGKILKG